MYPRFKVSSWVNTKWWVYRDARKIHGLWTPKMAPSLETNGVLTRSSTAANHSSVSDLLHFIVVR